MSRWEDGDDDNESELTSGSTTPLSSNASDDNWDSTKFCTGIFYHDGVLTIIELYYAETTSTWHVDDVEHPPEQVRVHLLDSTSVVFDPVGPSAAHPPPPPSILSAMVDGSITRLTNNQLVGLIKASTGVRCWTINDMEDSRTTEYALLPSSGELFITIRNDT